MIELLIHIILQIVAKYLMDIRRDHVMDSRTARFFIRIGLEKWWRGGNKEYNPSIPIVGDAWHTFDHVRISSFARVFVVALQGTLQVELAWYWSTAAWLFTWALIGQGFEYLYHYVGTTKLKGSFFDWLKRAFTFWKNNHKDGYND